VAGDDDRDLERAQAGLGEPVHPATCQRVAAAPAHRVVGLRRGAVDRYLHVEVIGGRDPGRRLLGDERAVGGELDPHLALDGVVDQIQEVAAHQRLAAADVDVEDAHPCQLVDQAPALLGGELPRVALARRGQAVRAGQVAAVGDLPGQADGSLEAVLEVVSQLRTRGVSGH
jgi:hypothetical protein